MTDELAEFRFYEEGNQNALYRQKGYGVPEVWDPRTGWVWRPDIDVRRRDELDEKAAGRFLASTDDLYAPNSGDVRRTDATTSTTPTLTDPTQPTSCTVSAALD
jgi:hypothetical protein